ncbi:MAG TPA: hypothetical protein PLV72_04215 [Candidatus Magasanikbacteria bacterium]|nr:hypothetical protein [Candidatus Magasanikbacteria bacterium]
MDETILNNILAKVVSMDSKMDSFATKEHLDERIDSVLTSTDRFVKLHETLDQKLAMLRSKYTRLEERVQSLEERILATI